MGADWGCVESLDGAGDTECGTCWGGESDVSFYGGIVFEAKGSEDYVEDEVLSTAVKEGSLP